MASQSGITSWIAGGVKETYVGFYDENGLFCGAAGKLANGEDSGMLRVPAVRRADISIPAAQRETQTGDDEVQGTLTFPSTEPVEVAIQTGVASQELSAAVQDINIYDDDQFKLVVLNPRVESYPLACLLTIGTAKQKAFGERGRKGWEIHLLNQGEISDSGPDSIAERTMRSYDYVMVCDQTFEWPWMASMSVTNEGTLGGAGARLADVHRLMLHAFRGNGTAATVTLDHTPRGDHSTPAVQVWKRAVDGTVTKLVPGTGFEVAPSAKTVTFTPAPAAGEHVVIRYQW